MPMIKVQYWDEFSERVLEVLQDETPALARVAHRRGHLLVATLSSPADAARELLLTTERGEITVGFGPHWHRHFSPLQMSFTSGGEPEVVVLRAAHTAARMVRISAQIASWCGTCTAPRSLVS
jgi:hypothetical protein